MSELKKYALWPPLLIKSLLPSAKPKKGMARNNNIAIVVPKA
jgi:hypothetical protein